MREPPTRVRLIGHPLVATPILGLCGFMLYLWFLEPGAWVVGLGGVVAALWTMRARDTVAQYHRWSRAWDSMAETPARRPAGPRRGKLAIAVAVLGAFVAYETGWLAKPSENGAALAVVVGVGLCGLAIVAARRRRLRVARPSREPAVRVVVRRPLFAVPTLLAAYDALPEHCRLVMFR